MKKPFKRRSYEERKTDVIKFLNNNGAVKITVLRRKCNLGNDCVTSLFNDNILKIDVQGSRRTIVSLCS